MTQDPCKQEREAMQEAQTNLVKIARGIFAASTRPSTIPDELREAIKQFRIASQNYESALTSQFEDSDLNALLDVTQIL